MILNGKTIRDVGGIEITKSSENPRYAITLQRGSLLADNAKLEAIATAKSELETQRFINAVFAANQYPNQPQIHIF
jgi:hypothetical protein